MILYSSGAMFLLKSSPTILSGATVDPKVKMALPVFLPCLLRMYVNPIISFLK